MFERDYLMRMIMDLVSGIRRSMERGNKDKDPSDAAAMLEAAIGEATEIDGATLLSLAPESIAAIMQVSGVDPHVTEYVARSLLLASHYHGEAGEADLAALREQQALAVAAAYGHNLSSDDASPEAMEAFLNEQ